MTNMALRARLWPVSMMFATASLSHGSCFSMPMGQTYAQVAVGQPYTPGVMIATVVPQPLRPFAPTSLSLPSEYDHAGRPDRVTIRRKDLEQCLRATIEETMCLGGIITTLACGCMEAVDKKAMDEDEAVLLN